MLHELVSRHAQTLLAELQDADGRGLPRHVERELAEYLRCGILAHGFARVRCTTCHDDMIVAFSCKRVLANLVENAIHAGEEAGNAGDVVIGWAADPRREIVAITVDDHGTGTGVREAQRETIFEPYVTTKVTGTGLGLAIARKIALEHGGDLEVAPHRAPTGGALFVVSLPRAVPTPRSRSVLVRIVHRPDRIAPPCRRRPATARLRGLATDVHEVIKQHAAAALATWTRASSVFRSCKHEPTTRVG